ncbi:wax ester/triacylglycerol synthase family O-acyltransferase [Aliiglaciecola sp. CAU 1673]|uniref:wax ester/triacylglycerol synthase domain-containing protein n=1 Tax=Aliiglaciecola sp. CAU 1673 TaxID=3032595 RepID=UPI0023DC0B01|nr:wax ester/triacylglycerol synthase domain-containing protein [Aliiglaciecola sp. CAU 1673]MDF2177118.1 wax ester/triacylglycerol synthase family O-acyltransferase [Aliiglaciecola sp. CAU 1673]
MKRKISFLDRAFWITESVDNPKHVACMQILMLPDDADDNYIDELVAELRRFDKPTSPFNTVVQTVLGFPWSLETVDSMDMNYHVKLHEIEDVSDKAALHKLVAKLHEPRLERDKPLWQYHVIKSRQGRLFAIYVKIHHMYGDGATLIRWFQAGYIEEAKKEGFVPVWALPQPFRKKRKKVWYKGLWENLVGFVLTVTDLVWILFRLLVKLLLINPHYMPIPFTGTKTVLTGQVKRGRVVSTTDLDFNRVHALSKRLRASANEILLCCIDIGVHRFLKGYGHSFGKALYTNMPINLRKPGEQVAGNKIAIVPVKLAHGETDPYLRLRQIIENHRIVKKAARKSQPGAFSYYTILIQSVALIFEMLRLSDWFKPIANILISNVPGPKEMRYLRDAKLLAAYPISTITPGGGVNVTLLTYGDAANIGIVCSDRNIDSLDNMAHYFQEAFELLERCVDDPSLTIEDIGEYVDEAPKSIILDEHHQEHESVIHE